jgi:hypothetical protein
MEMLGPAVIVESRSQGSALRLCWHHVRALGESRVREQQAPELAALSEDTSFIEDSTHACGTDPSDQNEIPLPESMQSF